MTSVEHMSAEALVDVSCGMRRLLQPDFQPALEALTTVVQHSSCCRVGRHPEGRQLEVGLSHPR